MKCDVKIILELKVCGNLYFMFFFFMDEKDKQNKDQLNVFPSYIFIFLIFLIPVVLF